MGTRLSRLRRRSPTAVLLVCLTIGAAFMAQQQIMTQAFDQLEADQVAQDAQRIRFALDAEVRLLTGYGSTNAVWDDSHDNVESGIQADFEDNFPPIDLSSLYGIDGALGVGPDGQFRIGGIAGSPTYVEPPPPLQDKAVLSKLFDLKAQPGVARCGVIVTSTIPYLYCGFASFGSSAETPPAGGLIFLKGLGPKATTSIGTDIKLPMRVVSAIRPGSRSWSPLASKLGTIEVRTKTVSADRIALMVTVPASPTQLNIEVVRDRPIHETAVSVSHQLFALVLALGAAVMIGLMLLVRRGTRLSIEPLLRTAQAVISSGDRTLRINSPDKGALGALGAAVDGMLDGLADQERRIAEAQVQREQELHQSHIQQRAAEDQMRGQANDALRETVTLVVQELENVNREADAVRDAARSIDDRVATASMATRGVVEQVEQVDRVTAELSASLRQVADIARAISTIAEQTRLLAFNATLEAARAGRAGRGFTIVASEVKELANETSKSTSRISRTVTALEQQAAAVATVIAGMADRTAGIDVAALELSRVADEQRTTLDRLNRSLDQARIRIESIETTPADSQSQGIAIRDTHEREP